MPLHKKPHTYIEVYGPSHPFVNDKYQKGLSEKLIGEAIRRYFNYDIENHTILRTENGKPYIPDFPISFNLSHSSNMIAIALSETLPSIGCDIQKVSPRYSIKDIAEEMFLPDEIQYMEEKRMDFFCFWSIKEAFVKYHGASIFDMKKLGSVIPIITRFSCWILSCNQEKYYLSAYPSQDTIINSPFDLKPVQL